MPPCWDVGTNDTYIAFTTVNMVEYKKISPVRCIHHFKLDLMNNIDHMDISSTELTLSQWSLSKQSSLKSWKVIPQKCWNKLKRKGMV